jgi:hypothetical protein
MSRSAQRSGIHSTEVSFEGPITGAPPTSSDRGEFPKPLWLTIGIVSLMVLFTAVVLGSSSSSAHAAPTSITR